MVQLLWVLELAATQHCNSRPVLPQLFCIRKRVMLRVLLKLAATRMVRSAP